MPRSTVDQLGAFFGPNAGYAAELYERFLQDPNSVDPATRAAFAGLEPLAQPAPMAPGATAAPGAAGADVSAAAAAAALAQGIRLFGHRGAELDPLGSEPPGDPQLDYGAHGVSEEDLARLPASVIGGPVARAQGVRTAADAIHR